MSTASSAPAGATDAGAATSAAAAGAAGGAPAAGSWTGKYTASKGTLFVPDGGEYSGVKWRGDDGTAGIGDGTLTIVVAADGRVTGTADGALGALTLNGIDRNGEVTASLRPNDPTGFTGTLIATDPAAGSTSFEGTMKLADAQDHLLRTATVHFDKK